MSKITVKTEKLIEGLSYRSFSEMSRELILINDNPPPKNGLGNYADKINFELEKYVELLSKYDRVKGGDNPANGRINPVIIKRVFYNKFKQQQPQLTRVEQSNVAEFLPPILRQMINAKYQDSCFVKYHKELTLDLGFMGVDYAELRKSYYKTIGNTKLKLPYDGIQDTEYYARYIIGKLIDRVSGYINYHCEHLKYDGVSTYKTVMNMADYDWLDYTDQKLYDDFKTIAKVEQEREAEKNNWKKVNYRVIPYLACEKFNTYKKIFDKDYTPTKLCEIWTFEIDGNFKPQIENTNESGLNFEIIKGFSYAIGFEAVEKYLQTEEYKNLIATGKKNIVDPSCCSDKDVRQALTMRNRDKFAKKYDICEENIPFDFSINYLDSYYNDMKIVIDACKI